MKNIIFLLVLFSSKIYADEIKECNVTRIIDGDTVTVICIDEPFIRKIRLYCIDAPEKKQTPYNRLSYYEWIHYYKKNVKVIIHGIDIYGRFVAELFDTGDNSNINLKLVSNGYAAVYNQYCPFENKTYYNEELNARNLKIGIWSEPGLHQTPWKYRKLR
jgi:endonuclease YncB( thermonuclease family)